MQIFKTYTGNAMLNNALMTIEALGELNNVSEITPGILLLLFKNQNLRELNKRMKSYTMLFSKNGPLKNDKMHGDKIYDTLFDHLLNNFETEGPKTCEISGLCFDKSFDQLFCESLKIIGLGDKEIQKKDTTLNRVWFPLIGGLGSDAQALPQAKYTIQIHPVCIPIMQFLPLSALLYKGGILLVDSSNFEFTREFIAGNVKEIHKRIQSVPSSGSIDNVRDFTKGHYLLKAIEILQTKEMEDEHSDLNLWSFSNSGTGANCEIERIPNDLIKKLMRLKRNTRISNELKGILNNKSSSSFLEALEGNQEWYLLHPNVFGSGKKRVEYEGVSEPFLEAYFEEISGPQKLDYAKYLSYLIDKYKNGSFGKYMEKRDGFKDERFHNDLYALLIKATENGEWDLTHHYEILDDPNIVPIKNNFYNILKVTHFYYYKKSFDSQIPKTNSKTTHAQIVCEWLASYILKDNKKENIKKTLLNSKEFLMANHNGIFYSASQDLSLDLSYISYVLFDDQWKSQRFGINSLLRLYFSRPLQENFEIKPLEKEISWKINQRGQSWFNEIYDFAHDYQAYYFEKYENKETGEKPFMKFLKLINTISDKNTLFLTWFYEAVENTNRFLITHENGVKDKWSEGLLYDPNGEYALTLAKFAIKFTLLKQHHNSYHTTHITNS